jgi:hypothetical protein
MACFKIALNGRDGTRGLHGGDEVVEEALLHAFKRRSRCRFRLSIERAVRRAGHAGRLKRGIEMGVNDLLSRGSGNAEERGVVLQSCGTFRHVLHIIL